MKYIQFITVVWTLLAGPLWAEQPVCGTFNGDLAATKFSDAATLTPESVPGLQRAWEARTGDVSDGSGVVWATKWSATPFYVNETFYVGMPFYRILALDSTTGAERWSHN